MTYSHICSHFWFYSLRPSYGGVMIVMVTVSLQQYFNRLHAVHELRSSRCSSRFRKSRRTRDEIAHVQWIIEKAREFQKIICFIDYAEAFDCVDHNKLEKSSRDGNTRPPYLFPKKSVCRSRSNS